MDPIKIRLQVDTSSAAESVREFVTETRAALDAGLTTAVDRAKRKLEELARQQGVVNSTIEQEKRQLDDLVKRRDSAHGTSKKQLDDEIANLRKIIENRKLELVELDKKKAKLEEVTALAVSSSEGEKSAIKAATDARIAELNVLRDTQRAHNNVNEEISKGIPIGRNFLTVMGGWAVVTGVLSVANSALSKMREDMEKMADAGERLRGLAQGRFEQERAFFAETGLRTATAQNEGRQTIDAIAKEQGIPRETVLKTAAALAPVFNQTGVKYDSAAGRGFIGQGSRFVEQGVDAQALADLYLDEQKRANLKLTPDQFNQRVSNLLATSDNSPSRLNLLLESYQLNRPQYEAAGLKLDDAAKIVSKLSENTSPKELPATAREVFHAVDRLIGLSPKQVAEMHRSMADFDPVQAEMLSEMSQVMNPAQMIQQQERLRKNQTAIPELDAIFEDAAKNGGRIDIKKAVETLSKLDQPKLERASRVFGGPRAAVALARASGFEKAALVQNAPMMPPPQAPEVAVQVAKEQAEADARQRNPPVASEAGFNRSMELETDFLEHNQQYLQGISNGWGFALTAGGGFGLAYASYKQQGAARVYERRMIAIARKLQAIRQGKLKASPEQIKALSVAYFDMWDALSMGTWGTNYGDKWSALGRLNGRAFNGLAETGDPVADQYLSEIDSQGEDAWITANQQLMHLSSNVTNVQEGARRTTDYEAAMRSLEDANKAPAVAPAGPPAPAPKPAATQPATQPAGHAMLPPTIIYQNRITNYGYGYDAIGGMDARDTRMG